MTAQAEQPGNEDNQIDHWSAAISWLGANGLTVDSAQLGSEKIVESMDLFHPPIDAQRLGAAWKDTQHQTIRNPVAWIAVLAAFRSVFRASGPALEEGLRASGLGWSRTLLEIESRLAGQLLALARGPLRREITSRDDLLYAALCVFREVSPRRAVMKDQVRRGVHGQHGIAALLLARSVSDSSALLEESKAAFERSEEAGDTSDHHFSYLLEVQLRQHRNTRSLGDLDEADLVWGRSNPKTEHRDLLANAAQLMELRAHAVRGEEPGAYLALLLEAEGLATRAIDLQRRRNETEGFLHAVRGRVRRDLYRVDLDLDGTRRRSWLDGSEADAVIPAAGEHLDPEWVLDLAVDLARILQRRNEHEGAMEILTSAGEELDHVLDSAAGSRWQAAVLDSQIFMGIAMGATPHQVAEWVNDCLSLPESTHLPSAAVSVALRILVRDDPDSDLGDDAMARMRDEAGNLRGLEGRHVRGHIARLDWIRSRDTDDVDPGDAADAFDDAIGDDPDSASAMLLADGGMAWLHVSRTNVDVDGDDALAERETLERAAALLDLSLARLDTTSSSPGENYDPLIVASRGGEAYGRLHAITRDNDHLDRGISLLERARRGGHPWPALDGHLGDLYYRRGRRASGLSDFDRAIELKRGGDPVRENRSVLAAAYLGRFAQTHAPADLVNASRYAHEAEDADGSWPWPHMQLAAITDAARGSEIDVGLGDAANHLQRAAQLAVEVTEFGSLSLGGQHRQDRAVYVLTDRHHLLQRTLVLKRLPTEMAERELATTTAFGAYLADSENRNGWAVPSPVGLVPHPDRQNMSVYVMERLTGPTLADLVRDASDPADLVDQVEEVGCFLAAYQGWQWSTGTQPETLNKRRRDRLIKPIADRAKRMGLSNSEAARLGQGIAEAIDDDSFAVAKRDAHAGNWIVAGGQIVAIDLETQAVVPRLWELVMLAFDHPFLLPSDAGWGQLHSLVKAHLSELGDRGVPNSIEGEALDRALRWYAIAHVLTGFARVLNFSKNQHAAQADRLHTGRRLAHGVASLRFLEQKFAGRERQLIAKLLVGVEAEAIKAFQTV